jgi:hypothetical protein
MLLKKPVAVYIARFSWVALPLTEARERLVGRSERSIFGPAVGHNQLPRLFRQHPFKTGHRWHEVS